MAELDGERTIIQTGAVVITTGGMEWNEPMTEDFLRGPLRAPASPPGNVGDGIEMGMELGADLGNMNEAWWYPTAHVPGETWPDGSPFYRMVSSARTNPGSIIVNDRGDRFCNESGVYHDMPKRFHVFDQETYEYGNLPAFAIFDHGFRRKYPAVTVQPGDDDPEWLAVAESIGALASELGIDPGGLERTVCEVQRACPKRRGPGVPPGRFDTRPTAWRSGRAAPKLGTTRCHAVLRVRSPCRRPRHERRTRDDLRCRGSERPRRRNPWVVRCRERDCSRHGARVRGRWCVDRSERRLRVPRRSERSRLRCQGASGLTGRLNRNAFALCPCTPGRNRGLATWPASPSLGGSGSRAPWGCGPARFPRGGCRGPRTGRTSPGARPSLPCGRAPRRDRSVARR